VIVQAASETQTTFGKQFEWESIMLLSKAGFLTCYNRGSRPGTTSGCNFQAHHPFKLTDMGPKGCFLITDTGTILGVLATGTSPVRIGGITMVNPMESEKLKLLNVGGLYGPANKEVVRNYAKAVKQAGDRAYGYYGFGHRTIDEGAMQAVGEGWK
jgi:hypothetical protein